MSLSASRKTDRRVEKGRTKRSMKGSLPTARKQLLDEKLQKRKSPTGICGGPDEEERRGGPRLQAQSEMGDNSC